MIPFEEMLEEVEGIRDQLKDIKTQLDKLLNSLVDTNQAVSSPRVALFIDAENVSHRKARSIVTKAKTFGKVTYAMMYNRLEPKESWKLWCKCANANGIGIRQVQGKRRTDMVDNIIQADIYRMLASDKFDVVCLASGDGGYYNALKKAKNKGKGVVVLYTSNVSKQLRKVGDKVLKL